MAFIITGLSTGGAEMMLYKLLSRMDRAQIQPQIVSLIGGGTLKDAIEGLGVPIYDLGMRRRGRRLRGALSLPRLMREIDPDIIQGWMYHGNLAASYSAWTGRRKVPVAWNIRQSLYGLKNEKRLTAAIIKLGALCSNKPAAIFYNSQTSAKQHEALGYSHEKRRIIPNGFDCDTFRPDSKARAQVRSDLGIGESALAIGLIARRHPMKDHRNFVAAAGIFHRLVPDAHFVLAGTGIDTGNQDLVAQLETAGLARQSHLLGERPDIATLNAAMDIATLSSAWGEGFPNVIGEAMACGVPCAVTDVGDSAWIVGETGRVAPPRDPEALAHAWYGLAEMGEDGRRRLGAAARQRIQSDFSLDAVVRQYEMLYAELIMAPH